MKLDKGCLGILLLLEKEPEKYNTVEICSKVKKVDWRDVKYLLDKEFIQFDSDYLYRESHIGIDNNEDRFTLDNEGKNYLAEYRHFQGSNIRWWVTTGVAVVALIVSILALFIK